jgi:hypothetical protein
MDLNLAVEVNYFGQNNAEYFAPVTVKIAGSELVSAKNSGLEQTGFDMIAQIKDEEGTTVSSMRDHMGIRLSDSTAAELAKRPITYNTGAVLLPALIR